MINFGLKYVPIMEFECLCLENSGLTKISDGYIGENAESEPSRMFSKTVNFCCWPTVQQGTQ